MAKRKQLVRSHEFCSLSGRPLVQSTRRKVYAKQNLVAMSVCTAYSIQIQRIEFELI